MVLAIDNSPSYVLKNNVTLQYVAENFSDLWTKFSMFRCLSLCDLNPNTNNSESIKLDFPQPLGPIMQEKFGSKGPNLCVP